MQFGQLILVIIIVTAAVLFAFLLGLYQGVEKTFKTTSAIGTLKVAHDKDGEKYLAIVIDPAHKDILDDNKKSIQMVFVEHVYPEESK